jgi:hypothetical protein
MLLIAIDSLKSRLNDTYIFGSTAQEVSYGEAQSRDPSHYGVESCHRGGVDGGSAFS